MPLKKCMLEVEQLNLLSVDWTNLQRWETHCQVILDLPVRALDESQRQMIQVLESICFYNTEVCRSFKNWRWTRQVKEKPAEKHAKVPEQEIEVWISHMSKQRSVFGINSMDNTLEHNEKNYTPFTFTQKQTLKKTVSCCSLHPYLGLSDSCSE